MSSRRFARGVGAALGLVAAIVEAGIVHASLPQARSASGALPALRAGTEMIHLVNASSRTRPAESAAVKSPSPRPSGVKRADKPVVTANAAGPGQAGYVHYFLLRMPDDTLEIQVGIETAEQTIAWSFPDLGVVISPFIEAGTIPAGGRDYEVWHLYAIRPFEDDAAMATLRRELAGRIQPWLKAGIPYCLNDGPRSNCMSCLGLVLRVLFPGRNSDYPGLPRDFWRAGSASNYTTRDLLLYLTGMLDLQTREARLKRISTLGLPEKLREDIEELVHAMGAFEVAAGASAAAPVSAPLKKPETRPSNIGIRPTLRRKL